MQDAEKLFTALESEKRKKGYAAPGENPGFIADITPKSKTESPKKNKTILKFLKEALNGEDHESWPLSRIIWRAGELHLKEAAPLILKLVNTSDPVHLYTCIWAICRTGDGKCIPFLSEILAKPYPSYIHNLAQAALINLSSEENEKKEVALLQQKLPESFQNAIAADDKTLTNYLEDLFSKFKSSVSVLVPFYLVSIKNERLRKEFLSAIQLTPTKAGYFKYIRQLFKISEMLHDTELYSILVKKIEGSPYNFSTTHDFINGKWQPVVEELKKEESTLAFSKRTKNYFSRRILRTLDKSGKDKSPLYTKYATDILLRFDDETAKDADVESDENGIYDKYSQYKSFYYILYANSPRYFLAKGQNRWICVEPYKPGQAFKPLREEAFATLWNNAPENIIKILSETNCEKVADFAVFVFQNNSAFKEKVNDSNVEAFIHNRSLKIQLLGFNLVQEKYPSGPPPTPLLVALLLSDLEEARLFAQQWIDKDPVKFVNDPDLLSIILLSENYNSHHWLQAFLLKNKAIPEVLKEVLNTLLKAIAVGGVLEQERHILSVSSILETSFKEAIESLDPQLIIALLSHPSLFVQGLAGKLLVLRKLDPSQVPDSIIFSLLQSEHFSGRASAIDLLNRLSPAALSEKQSLILSLCLSPLQDVRQSAQRLVDKLLSADPATGYGLVNLFIPVLTVKEKHEGLHDDILNLLSGKLANYLDRIETKKIIALCTSRYLAPQELGNILLEKYLDSDALSLRELNQLANSNLLKTRNYIKAYYSKNSTRAKKEKQEAVMLADSNWDDMRKFAFAYLKENFNAEDWSPELFITLCDSLKEDVQAFGREMITSWFQKDQGFEYLLKLSQNPDSRMQLFASGFLDQYATNNFEMLTKLSHFFTTLLSQVNKGHTAKMRAIDLLSREAVTGEENALLISSIFNRMSATASIQDKALYIKALLTIGKKFPAVNVVLQVKEIPVRNSKQNAV